MASLQLCGCIFIDIKPFVLHVMPEEEAYLCPVRAMAEWINASEITSGYVFRRMASGDRASQRDSPMVSIMLLGSSEMPKSRLYFLLRRPHNKPLRFSVTILLMSALIQHLMGHTHFAAEGANI